MLDKLHRAEGFRPTLTLARSVNHLELSGNIMAFQPEIDVDSLGSFRPNSDERRRAALEDA